MADFEPACQLLLKHEGVLADDSHDTGGRTKYGVSLRFLQSAHWPDGDIDHNGIVNAFDVNAITLEKACEIFKRAFWDACNINLIDNQRLANMVLGITVNTGTRNGVEKLQRAARRMVPISNILVDGILGPKTAQLIKRREALDLIDNYKHELQAFYTRVVNHEPDKKIFMAGWINRLNSY